MSNKIKDMLMEIKILKDLIAKLPEEEKNSVQSAINSMTEQAMQEVEGVLANIDENSLNEFINEVGKVKFQEIVKGKEDDGK